MAEGSQERKKFRRRLQRAVITTNAVGMPVLIIYVGAILNITITNLYKTVILDPFFFAWNVGLIAIVAIFLIWLHFQFVLRFARPVEVYLATREQGSDPSIDMASNAIKACLDVPFKTMLWSVIFYFIGVLSLLGLIQLVYTYSFTQSFMLFVGAFSTGVLISFFQFFTSKRVLIHVLELVLSDFPEFARDESLNQSKTSIRAKMLVAVIILTVVVVTLTGIMSYGYAIQSFQNHLGLAYKEEIKDTEGTLVSLLSIRDHEGIKATLDQMKNSSGDEITLTDGQGNRLEGATLPPRQKDVIRTILNGAEFRLERSRPIISLIHKKGIYCVILDYHRLTVIHHALPGGHEHLFVVSSAEEFKEHLRILWVFILIAIVVALVIAFAYAYYAAEEINLPLRSIVGSIQQVARGELSEPVRVISPDEIGVLALNQARMVVNLQKMIGRINEASNGIDSATGQISERSDPMSKGSAEQVRNTEETASAMEEMNQSINLIAENIETLSRSAEESSASILQMGATIDEVAMNVERLSTAVEQTTSSIQEMNLSVKEVADNAQQLQRRSGESMLALQEVENTIWTVGSSAQDTARISGQMAQDAEQGARAVAMTAKGIEKIRVSSEEAAEVIDALSQKAGQIGNILHVINDVTEETNLLALNAAIIAAQAGEHGRGFAVVADEIKDLAERTQASTQEIAELIQAVQEGAQNAVATVFKSSKNVDEGVKLSEEARAALEQILLRANQTTERTKDIAESTAVQSEKAKHVMNFFEGVNELIFHVAQATQEQSQGSDLIFKAAQEMEAIAQQVKLATKEQSQGSKQIMQAIESIAQIVNYINSAQGEQIKSSQAVVQAMQEIRNVAESNARRIGEMGLAVENLKFLARDLQEMVQQFKLRNQAPQEIEVKELLL